MTATIAIVLLLAYAIPLIGYNIVYWFIIDRKIIYDESAKEGFCNRASVDDDMLVFMATPIFNISIFAGLIKRLFKNKRMRYLALLLIVVAVCIFAYQQGKRDGHKKGFELGVEKTRLSYGWDGTAILGNGDTLVIANRVYNHIELGEKEMVWGIADFDSLKEVSNLIPLTIGYNKLDRVNINNDMHFNNFTNEFTFSDTFYVYWKGSVITDQAPGSFFPYNKMAW